jgi:hypothetical protein
LSVLSKINLFFFNFKVHIIEHVAMLTGVQQRTRLIALPLLVVIGMLLRSLLLLAHSRVVLSEQVDVTDLTRDQLVGLRHVIALT